jgi:putative ABC transport system ATP-binding protein
MPSLLSAGPFSATNGEGKELYSEMNVELGESELVILDGPSGSGKSTLLRQLVGLLPANGADRRLAGQAYSPQRLPAWRSRVTLVAQDAPMLLGTVGDNLRFPFRQRCGRDRRENRERRSSLLAAVGLGEIPETRDVGTLSGGERHRLALARGLLWAPPVLVADEPLSGLDEETALVCFDLMLEFGHRPGHSVLCVLHDRSLGARADRAITLTSMDEVSS